MDTEQEPLCEKNPIASPLPAEPANQPSEQVILITMQWIKAKD